MFKKFFIYALPALFLIACNGNKKIVKNNSQTDSTAVNNKNENTGNDAPKDSSVMDLIVSFYSIGSGTEEDQINKLQLLIEEFSRSSGKPIQHQKVRWGREGEIDYCFSLNELSAEQKKQFISKTREALKSAKWVHIGENLPCRKSNN